MRPFILCLTSALALAVVSLPAHAQQAPGQNRTGAQAMPPALQAAVLSGNSAAIQRAITTLSQGNPTTMASLAGQVMTAAEGMVATNPTAAAAAAASASTIAAQPAVIAAAPQSALSLVVSANRIAINPVVQQVAPAVSAAISVSATQVASNPQVFQVAPTAALQVMSDAYNSVSSPAIAAAAPNAVQSVTASLTQASANPQIAAAMAESGQVITAILTKQPLPASVQDSIVARGTASGTGLRRPVGSGFSYTLAAGSPSSGTRGSPSPWASL